jgi:RimJ/RimL family protein N-acetyltransferase
VRPAAPGRGPAPGGPEGAPWHDAVYRAAEGRGDWCYGIFDGAAIASYGWYATEPVPGLDGFWITFSPDYLYMHQGFTLPVHRGRQLHAYGMAHAAVAAAAKGYRGLISFVEVRNEPSLRSVARLGFRTFGTCWSMRILARRFALASPGCAAYHFRLALSGDPLLPSRNGLPGRSRL